MEPIGKTMLEMMKTKPELAKRMNDVKESLASNPIEILTNPSTLCPNNKCDGTGFIWIKDWSKRHNPLEIDEWQEPCECRDQALKQSEINKKLSLSGLPPIFKDTMVNSFKVDIYKDKENQVIASIARKAAGNYVSNYEIMKNSGKGLFLYSKTKGSGKTRLASSIANALVKLYNVSVAFIKADDLLTQVKETFNNGSNNTELQIIKAFREVDLLIIDDIAVEKPSEFAERILFGITDYRLEHKKTTIFTSNKTMDHLNLVYEEGRVKSRVKKMCLEIYMPEESIRDEEADQENIALEEILFKG